jgi:hypothetical protein
MNRLSQESSGVAFGFPRSEIQKSQSNTNNSVFKLKG